MTVQVASRPTSILGLRDEDNHRHYRQGRHEIRTGGFRRQFPPLGPQLGVRAEFYKAGPDNFAPRIGRLHRPSVQDQSGRGYEPARETLQLAYPQQHPPSPTSSPTAWGSRSITDLPRPSNLRLRSVSQRKREFQPSSIRQEIHPHYQIGYNKAWTTTNVQQMFGSRLGGRDWIRGSRAEHSDLSRSPTRTRPRPWP